MENAIIACSYAISCHEKTNHLYDGKPYTIHLEMCIEAAFRFIHLIPEKDRDTVFAAVWTHDVIEDCRQTYNDVKNILGAQVAEIVFACTNEKGKTRKDRANDKFYKELNEVPYANFVKICDRIANMEYSLFTKSKMAEMYVRELSYFSDRMWCAGYAKMFHRLNDLALQICKIFPNLK